MKNKILTATFVVTSVCMTGCASTGAGILGEPTTQTTLSPEKIVSPQPIEGNSGNYMSPYTSDEVIAEWVDKAINAKAGASIGGAAGSIAGQYAASELLGQFDPFGFGSALGKNIGAKVGRDQALKSAGGMEFIRETSDLSFNRWEDLAAYMYVNYSSNEDYSDVLSATQAIYPEMESYNQALSSAVRK